MFTEKLYYSDDYVKDFTATVLFCEPNEDLFRVILDRTGFFPEGGGQRSDIGYIGTVRVLDVREINGEIYHFVESPLPVNGVYNCRLDWEIRFRRMQEHSGEHIVSGIVHSVFGYNNVGFHMEDDYVTVDFDGEMTREQLDDVEDLANRAVYSNYPIRCYFPDESELASVDYRSKLDLTENVRLVEVENIDLCACCAPHVRSTGEIGVIKILDCMRHRGGVRIVIKSGYDALVDYRAKYKNVYAVSGLLSAKQGEIASAVGRLCDELDDVRSQFHSFKLHTARDSVNNLSVINGVAYMIVSGYDSDMMRTIANSSAEKNRLSMVFSGDDANGYSYIVCSHILDTKKFGSFLNTNLKGKGGGRDTMICGKCNASAVEIAAFVKKINSEEFIK